MFVGLLAHSFATIASFQWFSKLPSPLNGMVEGNHWDQWFSDGLGVRQPLVTMVFDGCAPLVRRWNGNVPSLKSKRDHCSEVFLHLESKFGTVRSSQIYQQQNYSKIERKKTIGLFSTGGGAGGLYPC